MHQAIRFSLLAGMAVLPLLVGCGPSKGIKPGESINVTDLGTNNAKPTRPEPPEDMKKKAEQPGKTLPPGNPAAPGKQPGLPPGRGGPG